MKEIIEFSITSSKKIEAERRFLTHCIKSAFRNIKARFKNLLERKSTDQYL